MKKLVFALAAAGSALVVATPASAQYYPARPVYGAPYGNVYGAPYGNAYGYNNWGQARALQVRVDAVQRQINRLDRSDRIRDRTADRLRSEARSIEHRLHRAERYGLNRYEANDIYARVARLEQQVQYSLASRYGRYGNAGWNGYNGGYYDRDRDGRDDRYEDDHGYRRD